jgi:WD40 repeat protein
LFFSFCISISSKKSFFSFIFRNKMEQTLPKDLENYFEIQSSCFNVVAFGNTIHCFDHREQQQSELVPLANTAIFDVSCLDTRSDSHHSLIACGSIDGRIAILDGKNSEIICAYRAFSDCVTSIEWHATDPIIIASSLSSSGYLGWFEYDASTKQIRLLSPRSHNKPRLSSSTTKARTTTNSNEIDFGGHCHPDVHIARFSCSGDIVASGGADCTVRLHCSYTHRCIRVIELNGGGGV